MAMEIATPIHAPVTSPASNLIISATTAVETQKKNRIQVSNTKKPLFFYVNLAKVVQKYPLIYHNNGFLVSKQPYFIYESRECKNWSFFLCIWCSGTFNSTTRLSFLHLVWVGVNMAGFIYIYIYIICILSRS